MKMSAWRMTFGLAALTLLTGALLPFSTGCGLAAGCPITDTGTDACRSGDTECSDVDTVRFCNSGGSCDAHWTKTKCEAGERCVVVGSKASCRPLG